MAKKLFVCKGAICNCTLQTTPGILDVISQTTKKLEGKLQATAGDTTFSTPFGSCGRVPSNPPPCTPMLTKWETTTKSTKINGHLALLENSTNTCTHGGQIEIINPNQTIGKTADVPTNELVNPFKGEVHFRRKMETGGAYALYPDGVADIIQDQIYGFDWIRDFLDGNEDYFFQDTPDVSTVSIIGSTSYKGKYVHYIDFDINLRKINSENFYFVTDQFEDWRNPANNRPHSEIIEYNSNRSKKNNYPSGSPAYNIIMGQIGGSYAAAQSSLLLTSFQELFKQYAPVKQYIDTPDGTERTGNNTGKITLNINNKNYYTPWLAALASETVKLYALFFLDLAAPPGEIRFESSSLDITIKPSKMAAGGLAVHAFPTVTQATNAVPGPNQVELEISFAKVITANETIEARFYDDKKKGEPDYKGDVIGVLNVLANKKEYEVTFRYVKVYFTDDNGWLVTSRGSNDNNLGTGPTLPAGTPVRVGKGDHTQATQLRRGQNLMNLFNLGGSQHTHLEHIFRQALIHYKNPIKLTNVDAVAIDISEIFSKAELQSGSGVVFKGTDISFPSTGLGNKFTSSIQQLAKAKVNSNKGTHNGVTMALFPYTFNNLFGVSDGIGGAAQNVFVTYLKHTAIANDRATAAHEALHSLDLYHSFVDSGKINTYIIPTNDAATKHIRNKTENVMDYTATARTWYKWQWEKVQKDLPDITVKP